PSNPSQTGRVEPVQAGHARIGVRQMAGERAQVAVSREPFAATEDFGRRDRPTGEGRGLIEQLPDDFDAFLRLERAAAINQDPAWLGQLGRPNCKPTLQRRECRKVSWPLEPGGIVMAAKSARRGS